MKRIDGPGATEDNLFTEGNPATGLAATQVTADWMNSVQEELANAIEVFGVALDPGELSQLANVLRARTFDIVAGIPVLKIPEA